MERPEKFKFALVGDQHFADHAPESRTDDYRAAVLGKFRWILSYCRSKGIRNVFGLGDMWHRKQPSNTSHGLVAQVISILREHSPDVRFHTLIGNHDYTTNLDVLPRQPMATVLESGSAVPVGLDGEPLLFECAGFAVETNGRPYSDREDGTERSPDAYRLKWAREGSFRIALFHATLLPDNERYGNDYGSTFVNFHQVAGLVGANLVACGHYHPGYDPPVQEAHGITWINPGSISRGSASDHNLTRPIRFVTGLWDGQNLRTRVVDVPHRPGREVFDVEALERRKVEEKRHSEFVEALTLAEDHDVSTLEGLCRMAEAICDQKDVVRSAQDFLRRAAEAGESLELTS